MVLDFKENYPNGNLTETSNGSTKLTTGNGNNIVIMGKNTYESLGHASLPNRTNIVVSKTLFDMHKRSTDKNVCFIYDLACVVNITDAYSYALRILKDRQKYGEIWLIGGAQIYESAIQQMMVSGIHLTYVDSKFPCDTFLLPQTVALIQKTIATNKPEYVTDVTTPYQIVTNRPF
tara:strand:+ start:33 stop:560 length:528 start_codon:yes stop_codon:yes gene_type:complete